MDKKFSRNKAVRDAWQESIQEAIKAAVVELELADNALAYVLAALGFSDLGAALRATPAGLGFERFSQIVSLLNQNVGSIVWHQLAAAWYECAARPVEVDSPSPVILAVLQIGLGQARIVDRLTICGAWAASLY